MGIRVLSEDMVEVSITWKRVLNRGDLLHHVLAIKGGKISQVFFENTPDGFEREVEDAGFRLLDMGVEVYILDLPRVGGPDLSRRRCR